MKAVAGAPAKLMEGQNLPLYELVVWKAARKAFQSTKRYSYCSELQAGENKVLRCKVEVLGECGHVIFPKAALSMQLPKVKMTPPFEALY